MSDGRTHYDGCWRDPSHHDCAVAEIERLREQLAEAEAELERRQAKIMRGGPQR